MIVSKTGLRTSATLIASLAVLQLATPVAAQSEEEDNSYLASLKACQKEKDATARLSCYDAAAATIVGASEAGELQIVDREAVRKTRRSLFGFSLPDLGIFGKRNRDGQQEEDIDELETTIAAVSGSNGSGYVLRTAEGAVWRIDSPPRRMLDPKVGDKLLIKDAALSSYFLRINGQGGVKGVRVR